MLKTIRAMSGSAVLCFGAGLSVIDLATALAGSWPDGVEGVGYLPNLTARPQFKWIVTAAADTTRDQDPGAGARSFLAF